MSASTTRDSPWGCRPIPRWSTQPNPWTNPPTIWPRSIPGLMDFPRSMIEVHARDFEFAGQSVDEDFAARDAVGEIQERRSAAGFAIEIDAGSRVETAFAEADPSVRTPGARHRRTEVAGWELAGRMRIPPSKRMDGGSALSPSAGLASMAAATSASRPRNRPQASTAAAPFRSVAADAAVGEVLLFLSVLVGADDDPVVIDSQFLGDDLPNPRIDSLAHLRGPGADHDRSVEIDVHQRVGLVHRPAGEGDPEFHRRQGHSAQMRRWIPR